VEIAFGLQHSPLAARPALPFPQVVLRLHGINAWMGMDVEESAFVAAVFVSMKAAGTYVAVDFEAGTG
jgi:hypothetical protein